MNIRLANKFDLPYYLHLVHKIHEMKEIGTYDVILDDEYLNTLFNTVLHGGGLALIAEHNDEVKQVFEILFQIISYCDERAKAQHRLEQQQQADLRRRNVARADEHQRAAERQHVNPHQHQVTHVGGRYRKRRRERQDQHRGQQAARRNSSEGGCLREPAHETETASNWHSYKND